MSSVKLKISSKGQISIPKRIRETFRSDFVELVEKDGVVYIKPAEPVSELSGSLGKYASNKTEDEKTAWSKHVESKYSDR